MKAVISGATRGIGKAIAQKLAKEKFNLVLLARTQNDLEACKKELENATNSIEILALDLSDKNSTDQLEKYEQAFKNTSLLVNNLGVYSTQQANELNIDQVKSQLELNLYSSIRLTQFILANSGVKSLQNIINIGSVMSLQAVEFAADYSISKHAFKAWNDGLRESLRKKEINVSAIYPGAVNTSSWDGIEADRSKMIQPEDLAEAVSAILKVNTNTLVDEIRISPRDFTY